MWCKFSSFRALLRNSEGKIEISFFYCTLWFQGTKVPQKIRVGGGARPFEKINILLVSAVRCMPPAGWSVTQMRGVVSDWSHVCDRSYVPLLCSVIIENVTSVTGHMYHAYVPFICVEMLFENVKKNNANNSNLFVFVDLKYISSLCRLE